MPAKTSPARVAAFLRALGETGNLSLAAERAKVSGTWVRDRRRADPDFRRDSDAAIAAARERLRALRSVEPAAGWRTQAGEELVVRGGGGRRVQVARARLRQWTPRTEARFLAALAACCNVRAACRVVGMTPPAAYHHYNRWPDFEKRWNDALEEGYLRLEMALIESAGRAFRPVDYPPDVPIEPMSVDQAMILLHQHQARVHKIGKPQGRAFRLPRTSEDVFESITHKLDRMEAKIRAEEMPGKPGARRGLDRGMKVVRGG